MEELEQKYPFFRTGRIDFEAECITCDSGTFVSACQDHQAGKIAIKCLFHGHNRMARVGFKPRPCRSRSRRSNPSTTFYLQNEFFKVPSPFCKATTGLTYSNWLNNKQSTE